MSDSKVRNPALARDGRKKMDWARSHMPVLNEIRKELLDSGELQGQRVGICLHLEAKTACLAEMLHEVGAEVAIAGSNPLSTQDDVAAALAETGVKVYAWRGSSSQEYHDFIERVLDTHPTWVIDDGGDLVNMLHTERREQLPEVKGGAEETTTGVIRLQAMAREGMLGFPMIAVNNALMKYLFDNRYGTGQSVWDAIMRNTNLVMAGKTVVVLGYGWCGKGVAMRAKGLGSDVIVCEVDPVKANEAFMDGFRVMHSTAAARLGDIFVTVTGNREVLRKEHFEVMRDGALLANAGHFDVEISKPDLASLSERADSVRPNVQAYRLQDGRRLYLLADGRLVNLAAADGHPVEIMDMSFAVQALALRYLIAHEGRLGNEVIELPREIDEQVARLRLRALNIEIDSLTPEQRDYQQRWQTG